MLEKLKGLSQKYAEIEYMLSQSEVWADAQKAAALSREKAELAPLMEAYARYETFRQEAESAEELLSDPEMKDLARETLSEARSGMERTAEELKILLLPKDPDDGKNVIVEIRGGVGGEESALFAADLFRMYEMYAERKGFSVEIVNRSETELGGIREIDFIVGGTNAFSRFRFESGVHRVQRVPETETQGRIHTSTCTVAVLPELEEAEFHLDPAELQIDTFRSSGAGGQKVNKTSSAIRVTHLPTGTVVECQDERSQYKNKARALSVLASRLAQAEKEKQDAAVSAQRRSQVGSGSGKTTVTQFLTAQGVLALDCDKIYHELLETNADMLAEIEARFPAVFKNGKLDRKMLGAIVFAVPEALRDLNAITHRYVREDIYRRLREYVWQGGTVAVVDAIALFESGISEDCVFTVGVTAPDDERCARIMARDGIDADYALARIEAQPDDEYYEMRCDYLLRNDGTPEELKAKCRELFGIG